METCQALTVGLVVRGTQLTYRLAQVVVLRVRVVVGLAFGTPSIYMLNLAEFIFIVGVYYAFASLGIGLNHGVNWTLGAACM